MRCEVCGKIFERRRSHVEGAKRHFCSHKCRGVGFQNRVDLECVACGDSFSRLKSFDQKRSEDGPYCSYDCMWSHMNGSNHPHWGGGKSPRDAIRRTLGEPSWRALTESARDAETCRMCNASEGLTTHHIIPLMAGGSNHSENLLVLCRACHASAESFTRDRLPYPIAATIKNEINEP